jgi:D-alanine-D-alanine ligase
MLIGMTYDLRKDYLNEGYSEEETAEFDSEVTIDTIEKVIRELGHAVERIGNAKNLVRMLSANKRWDLVFNIAEGLKGLSRESLVPSLLEAYDIPYTFSDGLVLAVSLHKGMTKHVIRNLGIPTADFAVVNGMEDLAGLDLPFPLFAKPVAEGTGKGIDGMSKITDRDSLVGRCEQLLRTFRQPVLVETFLPGREFTVAIIGTGQQARVIGGMEIILNQNAEQDAYTYVNKEEYEERVKYSFTMDADARKAADTALAAWKGLGCRDAGRVDVRLDGKGRACFIEVNPLAGLNPLRSDLPIICGKNGINFRELIRLILDSAMERVKGG